MTFPTAPENSVQTPPQPVSRQAFLQHGWTFLLGKLAESLPEWPATTPSDRTTVRPALPLASTLRPPGAIAEAAFLDVCAPYCTNCRDACPRGSLLADAAGQPILIAEQAPCVMCVDIPCTQVCPTGALIPTADPRSIALGTAVIELTVCTAFRGSGCRTCYTVCPLPDEAIQLIEGLPQIVPESCTGCGVCVYECPEPGALTLRPAPR